MMGSINSVRSLLLITLSTVALSSGHAREVQNQVTTTEEAFLIRRIAEFWKDGDNTIVKSQITSFFEKYPNSSMSEYFLGIMGDLHLQEGNCREALEAYSAINSSDVYQKIVLNKLQCYYELSDYEAITKEGTPFLSSSADEIQSRSHELHFLLGEANFRMALNAQEESEKVSFAAQALPFYESLESSAYGEISRFALAEINHVLGHNEEASKLYLELATNHPGKEEELLFQAAVLQAQYDKEAAIANFEKVRQMSGEKEIDASYNTMVLLFEQESYEKVLELGSSLQGRLGDQFTASCDFMCGKSHFALDHIQDATLALEKFVAAEQTATPQLKNALLIEMSCARLSSNEELFAKAYERYSANFADDGELPKALFMYSMLQKESGNITGAHEKLVRLKNSYPDFEDRESLIFELAHLSHEQNSWTDSRDGFATYLTEFGTSDRSQSAWKFFLSSCLNLHKEGGNYSNENFYQDLTVSLSHDGILSSDEQRDCHLLHARIAYEIGKYDESLELLSSTLLASISEETHSEILADAYFLTALNYQALGQSQVEFCINVENALRLCPETYATANTHLQLYNAYISLSSLVTLPEGREVALSDHEREYGDHAAKHLFSAYTLDSSSVKDENRVWLANYYYANLKPSIDGGSVLNDEYVQRAVSLYSSLLLTDGTLSPIENIAYEGEVLKLAELLTSQGMDQMKLGLVQNLIEQQSTETARAWKYQKQALFELARTYETLGEREKALETFSFINASQESYPSAIANIATLECARLQYKMLPKEVKNEDSIELIPILNNLKELQIRKMAESEPLHLEAALEYATIRSEVAHVDERDARHLFFLKRIKEDFNAMDDVVVQEYQASLNEHPEKKALFDAYMKYVDGEILRLNAKQLASSENTFEMEEVNEKALSVYGELRSGGSLPRDLVTRIEKSISEINSSSSY